MIAQSVTGRGFGGLLRYLLEKKDGNTRDPEDVAVIGGNMCAKSASKLTKEFNFFKSANKRVINPVWHVSLSRLSAIAHCRAAHRLVCNVIPFSSHQLRYRARLNPRAREEYSIWKEDDLFIVQMERFGPWIKGLWKQFEKDAAGRKGTDKA